MPPDDLPLSHKKKLLAPHLGLLVEYLEYRVHVQ